MIPIKNVQGSSKFGGPLAQSHGGWGGKHRIDIPKPILSQILPPKGRLAYISVWYLFTEPYPQ